FGYQDPLSGLSAWSFWPTLPALATMLANAGFVAEILETDTVGVGQSPYGATVLARHVRSLSRDEKRLIEAKTSRILGALPATSGGSPPVANSWLRKGWARCKRLAKRAASWTPPCGFTPP